MLCDYVRDTEIDGEPLKDDPIVRSKIAQLVTQGEVSRLLGLRVVDASVKSEKGGGAPPTIESSEYKLFATEFSRRLANASMDIGGPARSCACAPKKRRWPGAPSRPTATP